MPYNGRRRPQPPRSPPGNLALTYRYGDHYRSRYTGSRYNDGDRRSRSPSPTFHRDRGDRAPQYGDNDRRRPSAVDTRANPGPFQSNRDTFAGREPPRGPKALLDAPSGPRGGGFAGEFRGRGRGGGGRGRAWRDDSRDRGRDREPPDYRDRPHFRDDRSREREREWRDRDRDLFPRGRRPSPPPGRGRSPPGRDFRDGRDVPLGVDAERARRGSRDGPLSAGSSNSDPPFGPSSFRGGGFQRGGRGRGRGDWDRGRGRGNFYDDPRDRYGPRSRSQEGRWAREPEERDRRDLRYLDSARDLRDDRGDIRDRLDRELIPPRKLDRVSHEPPPSTKDVSPPPLAPSAPAFGSVPSRQPSTTDIQSLTGKAPPTGPRALTEERPVSAGHPIGGDRPPHSGPVKPSLPDGSPPIPVGPRAQQQKQQQRSSKQWINPALQGKKLPESPKGARSHSFASQQSRPFGGGSHRPESSHSDQHPEIERRPRSSDAKSDSHVASSDGHLRGLNISGLNDVAVKSEISPESTRPSVDLDTRPPHDGEDAKMADVDVTEAPPAEKEGTQVKVQDDAPAIEKHDKEASRRQPDELSDAGPAKKRRVDLQIPAGRVQLPVRQISVARPYSSSESDDDEDYDTFFEQQITKTEAELKKLEDAADSVPIRIVARYAKAVHEAMLNVVNGDKNGGSGALVGPIPDDFTFPCPKPGTEADIEQEAAVEEPQPLTPAREPSAIPTVEKEDEVNTQPLEPQPKVEEMDTGGSGLPPLPTIEQPKVPDEDVDMQDVAEAQDTLGPLPQANGVRPEENGLPVFPPGLEQPVPGGNSNSADVESEDKTEDDASIYGSIGAVREYSATPPTDDLPVFNLKPWYQSKKFHQSLEQTPGFDDFLLGQIDTQTSTRLAEQEALRQEYGEKHELYLRFTLSDDPAAVKSRDYFANKPAGTSTSGKASAGHESRSESSRRAGGRWATELDIETAIQQSLKEHKEREEREAQAQREKYRTEKEAIIPPMFWTPEEKEQGLFYDTAGLLPIEKLVATWQVVPWHVNFTEEEAEKFEKAYLESPKQWGKIAKDLPNRDFGTCIQYYYAKKRELNLKEKLRKQPRKRKKGRGKQRSSALVSELGNTENETEEPQENGDGTERTRRPRRAAAPTFAFEATQNADSDGTTPTATPGRRRAGTLADAKNDSGAEKAEPKKPGRKARQPKADKEAKVPKPAQNLAPTPPATQAKGNRSRSNSRAQGPEWLSPQTPADLGPRPPPQFEVAPGGMQPPIGPAQHQPLASPDRAAPPVQAISDMMAPPQLRPDPVPPQASVPTFEIGQPSGSERVRNPQQASSYWSVAEATDFPHLLKAFGTNWVAIAAHMQTKTAIMVKNYYVRQKDGSKPDWEAIAAEADAKAARGEKRPAPPAPSTGPRKRYDVPSTGHRPLAAAEAEDGPSTKAEASGVSQPFSRFPVPIAQASPVPPSLAPPASGVMAAPTPSPTNAGPLLPSQPAQQAPPQLQPQPQQLQQPKRQMSPVPPAATTQTMSPNIRPRVPAPSPFTFPDRESEPAPPPPPPPQVLAQQPVRISQKPVPAPIAVSGPPVTETGRPTWAADLDQMSMMSSQQQKRHEPREPRERQIRIETPAREPIRIIERPPARLKQEPEHPMHHQDFQQYQPPQRVMQPQSRKESMMTRQPEPPRSMPPTRSYTPPIPAQPPRAMMSDHGPMQHVPPQITGTERPMSTLQRPMPTSMQEQYVHSPVTSQPPPIPPPQSITPAPSRPVERKTSSLMALLNDDPPAPAPPKRINEMTSITPNSTPPPSASQLSARAPPPPTSISTQQRREVESPGYAYPRSAGPQSGIPPLKPTPHPQSPQPQHMSAPRSALVSPMVDSPVSALEAQQREYYRHPFQSQHQASASNSPQSQQVHHYPPTAQHEQRMAQQHAQHSQPSPIAYQAHQPYSPYPVTQPHAASPTPQYAPHPSMGGRRDTMPPSREAWPQPQQPSSASLSQHSQHSQPAPQPSWAPHQGPPKTSQPPAPSPWAAAQVQSKPSIGNSMPQQQQPWPATMPPSQQPHPLSLRDSRAGSVYGGHESHSPGGMAQHQHSGSIGSSRYAVPDPRRGDPGPPPPSQPPYARYSNTPGPGQGRDHPSRSFTPVSQYDPRGGPPPGPPYGSQNIIHEAQIREAQHQMREMGGTVRDPRELGRDSRELAAREQLSARDLHLREMAAAREREQQRETQQQHPVSSILQRQLRPGPQHDPSVYDRGPPPPPDRRYG